MSLNPKKYTPAVLFLLAIFVAGPLTVAATLEEDLKTTKTDYEALWHTAASVTERRAELEADLESFDTRVAEAKLTIQQIGEMRKNIREQIADDRVRINALNAQLRLVDTADTYYGTLSARIRYSLADFARFLAEREIAADGGPGSASILMPLFSGSLGEHIDDALARDAVLRARTMLLSQASVITAESDRVRSTLVAAAEEYALHLAALEKEQQKLGKDELSAAAFVDQSWRQKTLTEEELRTVAAEAKEASDRVAAIQADLLKINQELKEQKIGLLTEQKAQSESDMALLSVEIDSLLRKDAAMSLIQKAVLDAERVAQEQRNTDRKLYQKIDIQELMAKNLQDERDRLSGETPIDSAAIKDVDRDLAIVREMLVLMRQGVPEDAARDFAQKKLQASTAADERKRIADALAELRVKRSAVERSLSTVVAAIDSVEQQFSLSALPPIFIWPVTGPISAGYLDTDYVHVFGVAHRGMDIAVKQGTPVKAITDGIVHTVRDGGATGYSYVLIGHRNGYASLYGHMSKFLVREGDVISAGKIIGLSGGTPGTPGAGHMTTGAHLHLEVTKDGAHMDPRAVLP